MLALVILETFAIALLGLLVAGLLRSHAEILRQLHHLGGGLDLPGAARRSQPVTLAPRRAGDPAARPPVIGPTPDGDLLSIALDRPGERTLLLFLSSGCGTCAPWWEGLRNRAHDAALPDTRIVVVARDAEEESPSLLAGLGPDDVPVVLSSAAWESFAVPGSPYAALVADGRVVGEGVAAGWEQMASLVAQHLGDLGKPVRPSPLDGRAREHRADAELQAAGIHPGHPSLHPEPGSWSRS